MLINAKNVNSTAMVVGDGELFANDENEFKDLFTYFRSCGFQIIAQEDGIVPQERRAAYGDDVSNVYVVITTKHSYMVFVKHAVKAMFYRRHCGCCRYMFIGHEWVRITSDDPDGYDLHCWQVLDKRPDRIYPMDGDELAVFLGQIMQKLPGLTRKANNFAAIAALLKEAE